MIMNVILLVKSEMNVGLFFFLSYIASNKVLVFSKMTTLPA
jgi:hypothetical protein